MKIQMTRMEKQGAIALTILSTLTLCGAKLMPVMAEEKGSADSQLVDPDWEKAVSKHFEKRLLRLIDADEAQQTKITGILSASLDKTLALREQLREGAVDLVQMFADQKVKDEDINAKVHELRTLKESLMDQRLSTALAVRKELTEKQLKILSDRITSIIGGNGHFSLLRGS